MTNLQNKAIDLTQTIIDLWRESTLIQGILTVLVSCVWLYMIIAGRPIPEVLNTVEGLIVGFYFGTKTTQNAKSVIENAIKYKNQ